MGNTIVEKGYVLGGRSGWEIRGYFTWGRKRERGRVGFALKKNSF